MEKQTFRPIQEGLQLSAIVLVVTIINIAFAILNQALFPENGETLRDNIQIGEMQDYQISQENINTVYY